MSRYIDADALLEKVQFRVRINDDTDKTIKRCVEVTRNLIKNAPTADVVAVVRCKDCRHMTEELGYRYCNVWERINGHGDDGFCCYGERRSE